MKIKKDKELMKTNTIISRYTKGIWFGFLVQVLFFCFENQIFSANKLNHRLEESAESGNLDTFIKLLEK